MSEPSEDPEQLASSELPLPRRKPAADRADAPAEPRWEPFSPPPERLAAQQERLAAGEQWPGTGAPFTTSSRNGGQASAAPGSSPPSARFDAPPRFGAPLPSADDRRDAPGALHQTAEPLPRRDDAPALPQRPEPLPQRGAPLPQRGEPLPQRGDALPRRKAAAPRAGRHRSPHRLTVPSDAPALVLAVPGAYSAANADLADEIATAAQHSCPGAELRIGFLSGPDQTLADAISFSSEYNGQVAQRAVVVPLLAAPHPAVDAAVAAVVGEAADPLLLGTHLGPHPLLAEVLHARLAEAGLARTGRARGLSIATGANGALVLADRGAEATQAAGVTAVLLAARLAMPTAPASIDDQESIEAALTRLREAGVSMPAIAPCVIGPETPAHELEALSDVIGAPCAAPLGAHPVIAQLVAIRYGAALAGLSMAG
ncbi:MAG TPA: hypothetical protein VGI64_00860 [Streptosporangiaceae bacterium]